MRSLAFSAADEGVFDALPETRAVYLLLPRSGEPYLGRTARLRTRLRRLLSPQGGGRAAVNLGEVVHEVRFQVVGSEFEAAFELYRLARDCFPDTYRERLRLRGPVLLKLNLANAYPRLYVVRGIGRPPSVYFGPFRSRVAAERFSGEFLDYFKMRRCVDDLRPDPAFPGCVYSEMKMCLAPCFKGCSDDVYAAEVERVRAFLASSGVSLVREIDAARDQASAALEFEKAAAAHTRREKLQAVLRQLPAVAAEIETSLGVIVVPAAAQEEGSAAAGSVQSAASGDSVRIFACARGGICASGIFSLAPPVEATRYLPMERRLREWVDQLFASEVKGDRRTRSDHLALIARWSFRSRRKGELITWTAGEPVPAQRIVGACRRVLRPDAAPAARPGDAPGLTQIEL